MQMTPSDHDAVAKSQAVPVIMGGNSETVSWGKLIFADGTTVWTRGGPAPDHILHPLVIKFVLICVLIYALLHSRPQLEALETWQAVIYWIMVMIASTLWLVLAASVSNRLMRMRIIRFIYSPLISIPLILVNESLFQVYLVWGLQRPWEGFGVFAPFVVRDVIVIILFDILYGSYVAPRHPAYRLSDPQLDTSVATLIEAPADAAWPHVAPRLAVHGTGGAGHAQTSGAKVHRAESGPAPGEAKGETRPAQGGHAAAADGPAVGPALPVAIADAPARKIAGDDADNAPADAEEPSLDETIELAGERIRPADLLVIQAEDHYVRIHQRGRSVLLRGRFSDVVGALPPDLGVLLNRSVWVSRAGIRTLHRSADHRLMVLARDEQTHPVARSRKTEVLDFARRHNITIARRKSNGQKGE